MSGKKGCDANISKQIKGSRAIHPYTLSTKCLRNAKEKRTKFAKRACAGIRTRA